MSIGTNRPSRCGAERRNEGNQGKWRTRWRRVRPRSLIATCAGHEEQARDPEGWLTRRRGVLLDAEPDRNLSSRLRGSEHSTIVAGVTARGPEFSSPGG